MVDPNYHELAEVVQTDSNESIAIYQSKPTLKNKKENSPLTFGQF